MDSAEQAKNVVKQLLQFARQQETRKESLNLNTLLTDIEPVVVKILGKTHSVAIQTMDDPLVIYGDSSQIQQVLLNMAVNANDAMEDGGSLTIRLTLQNIEEEEATKKVINVGHYAKISLSDTGKGIPKNVQDQIFAPFFTTKPQGKGTGLGLSVSHGVIQTHRGIITCDSEENMGTTFNIYLPIYEVANTANQDTVTQELVNGQGKKVLVIDDEKLVGRVTCNVLKKLNYTVDYCDNTIDGIEKYKEIGHDIIVLDYQMDNIDGIESYYMFREITPNIKALLYTGDLYSDNVRAFAEKESVPLVYKPLDLYQISAVLIALHH
jgi:two-component system cell cycle sensor histidine kinase/response regulator CckA